MNGYHHRVSVSAHGQNPSNSASGAMLFAEKFNKVTFRDFTNNTRLNINNIEYAEAKVKRDRQINYWKNNVIQNFLPPINQKKRKYG